MSKTIKITLFHAEWCGHCKNFAPVWEHMTKYKKAKKNIKFASYKDTDIDELDQSEKTINGQAIEGFPTLKINIGRNEYNYMGDRSDSKHIYQFIKDKINNVKTNNGTMSVTSSSGLMSMNSSVNNNQRGGKSTVVLKKMDPFLGDKLKAITIPSNSEFYRL